MVNSRLCIYILSDSKGMLDAAAVYYLKEIQKSCDKILLVADGFIIDEFGEKLHNQETEVCDKAYGRQINLMQEGWDELIKWDEVILTGDAVFGPVYPLEEMFSCMAQQDQLDFWGAVSKRNYVGKLPATQGYVPVEDYISSGFIVFRSKILRDEKFRVLCESTGIFICADNLNNDKEQSFTKQLSEWGYKWDVYVKTPENGNYSTDYLLMDPVDAIKKKKCPVFYRKSFCLPQIDYLCVSAGEQPWELFRYLRDDTEYDTDLILDYLIHYCHQDDIVRSLRMTYVLPSENVVNEGKHTSKVALVMHLYYMDLLDDSLHYASAMPEEADVYVITDNFDNADCIRNTFSSIKSKLEIRVTQNRGRDVGSLLVGAADLQSRYDIICFYHDKKTAHIQPHTVGNSFAYKSSECILSSEAYVRNVISLFERKPEIGIAAGPNPNHATMLRILSKEWGENYAATKKLAEELDLHVPMSEDHIPAIGMGNLFWYRTKALEPLFRKGWKYEDFPEEPVGLDGTILHAMERIYPFAAQAAGYFPARIMPDHIAALELDNLSFYVREFNRARLDAQINGNIRTILEKERERLDPRVIELAKVSNLPAQIKLSLQRRFSHTFRRNEKE